MSTLATLTISLLLAFSLMFANMRPVMAEVATPYPAELFTSDNAEHLKMIGSVTPAVCPEGNGVMMRFTFSFKFGTPEVRVFRSIYIKGSDGSSIREILVEFNIEEETFKQAWVDIDEDRVAERYFDKKDDLLNAYPHPCDVLKIF